MTPSDLVGLLEFARGKTRGLVEALAALPDPAKALSWRPGPGRAHLAWQLMHIAATDDRHLNTRMKTGIAHSPELVRRFAGGSTPDDDIPPLADIIKYLTDRRADLLDHLCTLTDADMAKKPNDAAQWVYEEWFRLLAWHEAHHHGQAHLTLNLYRASQDATVPKVGH
ncbi:MAG: DinB family protein [Planctomycetaceae bacterium]|nr:DinB family protein [Planctomycetaceae bacterium]